MPNYIRRYLNRSRIPRARRLMRKIKRRSMVKVYRGRRPYYVSRGWYILRKRIIRNLIFLPIPIIIFIFAIIWFLFINAI